MQPVLRTTQFHRQVRRLFGYRRVEWIVVGGIIAIVGASTSLKGHEGLADNAPMVTIQIENRQFVPHVIRLRVGQRTRLVLQNNDVELHAFVPSDLFVHTNVQVEGNGAPQFDEQGFRRVLLPSNGQVDLTFSPKHAGSYSFFCDLPGHVMNGTIVVEEY